MICNIRMDDLHNLGYNAIPQEQETHSNNNKRHTFNYIFPNTNMIWGYMLSNGYI